jgi:surface antigen
LRRVPALGVALTLAFVSGGCSFSYQLDSMFSRQRGEPETTGSIRPATPRPQVAGAAPADGDIAAARTAVSEALGRSARDASVPWEDSSTGARGTVTPLSAAYSQDGTTCRDFLASYVRNGSESWLQGEACRGLQGRWEVRRMRPWRRT